MSDIGIGKLITDEDAGRDAIHIAVAPVVAAAWFEAGDHIGLDQNGMASDTVKTTIGIVDPFLTEPVKKGDRFWMFLYPNTITSLRHQWVHPAFKEETTSSQRDESIRWIERFAPELEQSYDSLMAAADDWVVSKHYTYDNSESYKGVDYRKWPAFWRHYEVVRGVKVDRDEGHPFTCSC